MFEVILQPDTLGMTSFQPWPPPGMDGRLDSYNRPPLLRHGSDQECGWGRGLSPQLVRELIKEGAELTLPLSELLAFCVAAGSVGERA